MKRLKKTSKLLKKLNKKKGWYSPNKLKVKVKPSNRGGYHVCVYMKVKARRPVPEYYSVDLSRIVPRDDKLKFLDKAIYDIILEVLVHDCNVPQLYDLGTGYENRDIPLKVEAVSSVKKLFYYE